MTKEKDIYFCNVCQEDNGDEPCRFEVIKGCHSLPELCPFGIEYESKWIEYE